MTGEDGFPQYIRRSQEREVLDQATRVRRDGRSRAVLLYGDGGVGKTRLLHELAGSGECPSTIWLDPMDLDDTEYWLLSNLERKVVEQLDPGRAYFGAYRRYLSRLPQLERSEVARRSIVGHLATTKRVFADGYREFVESTNTTLVMSFDTVEVIRNMDLILTLVQWMRALPRTLFVVSGRPPPEGEDIIRQRLEDPHHPVETVAVHLAEFDAEAALWYLETGAIASGLAPEERGKLVHLTQGHPLWLALTLDYLRERGIPRELDRPMDEVTGHLPYHGVPTREGLRLQDAFKRRLITPYRQTDFWHESTKRLAVVRRNVSQGIWRQLMADRDLPPGTQDWDQAWRALLGMPWIRPRASQQYVTLHDVLAEELANRILPLHDPGQEWREQIWRRVGEIYGGLVAAGESDQRRAQSKLDDGFPDGGESDRDTAFVEEISRLSADTRRLDQVRAAWLHYQILLDPRLGAERFLELADRAKEGNEVLFQSLINLEMQRVFPGAPCESLGEAFTAAVTRFQRWLVESRPQTLVEIGIRLADHLIANQCPDKAVSVLTRPLVSAITAPQRYRVHILLGNAYLRVMGRIREAEEHLIMALGEAQTPGLEHGARMLAEAHKELGYCYRNKGLWRQADVSYQRAHDTMWASMSSRSSDSDRSEMASIRSNWAYVKGLRGDRRVGRELVESAIRMRQSLNQRHAEGTSWSVYGELLRFDRDYGRAWECYGHAESLFKETQNRAWLGHVYQQQAICLHQSARQGVDLVEGVDNRAEAERMALEALGICRHEAIRGYPSALNRAGRIFACRDIDRGLRYLATGIEQARDLSDGWFWLANLVEYSELSYLGLVRTGEVRYRDQILAREPQFEQFMDEYIFPELRGRWYLVRGHLSAWEALRTGGRDSLPEALSRYTEGFRLIADSMSSSHGVTAVRDEFAKFKDLFRQLPSDVQRGWEDELRVSWGGSITLQARLEELY